MKNKLELTWVGKDEEIKVEPRILIEAPSRSNTGADPETQNMLIHGDNLLALKALKAKFAGQVKCIYIDPPYNTGSAFEHYDDNLEHSIWLDLMYRRLKILRNLLDDDGAIFVQIDSVEMPYLKVVVDEVFGRKNFINIVSVKAKIAGVSGSNLGKSLQDNVEYILMVAKNAESFELKFVPQKRQELTEYIENYITSGKSWKYTSVFQEIDEGEYIKSFEAGNGDEIKLYRHHNYEISSINRIANTQYNGNIRQAYGSNINRIFRTTNAQTSIRTKVIEHTQQFNNRGIFSIEYVPTKGKNAGKLIRSYYKDKNLIAWLRDVVEIQGSSVVKLDNMGNLWDDIEYNNLTKEGDVRFPDGKKPEKLVERIIRMTTNPGDLVLDSFLGSGTTAAVAHKMGRRWIGIEMGDHAYTHCKVRLDKVIAGEDSGGITSAVDWQGGGGYKFYELAPTLIETDAFGEAIINKEYDANMLASAVALHEGFKYAPDSEFFWKQSVGSENSYLFVTTRHIDNAYLESIQSQMADDEYLTIACTSFSADLPSRSRRVSIKKIPEMLLNRCEFGKNDYNLNIVDPPVYESEDEVEDD